MISRMSLLAVALAASSFVTGCSSDDGKPADGTTGGQPSASTTPGSKKATEICVVDADCETNVCYQGDQGSYCSLKCTAETAGTVCVAPYAGTCNKKGFCKKL